MEKMLMMVTADMNSLFFAFTAILESYSAEESCTGTHTYLESLLQRKAAQAPMLIWNPFCRGKLHRHPCLPGIPSAEETCTGTHAYLESLLLRKAAQAPMFTWNPFCRGKLHVSCGDVLRYWSAIVMS